MGFLATISLGQGDTEGECRVSKQASQCEDRRGFHFKVDKLAIWMGKLVAVGD